MEGRLDIGHGTLDVQYYAVGMSHRLQKPVGFGKSGYSLIILFGWSKPSGELFGSKKFVKIGAGRIVQTLKKTGQLLLIAKRQTDGQAQFVSRIGAPNAFQPCFPRLTMA